MQEFIRIFQKRPDLLKACQHGLEKESLRVQAGGKLSMRPHPQKLGAALTHPNYTLDFSEAQLEFVTDPFSDVEKAYRSLEDLHAYAYRAIGSEWLWPHSAPCRIQNESDVPLAQFGETKAGYEKWLYRSGLSHRCGNRMQLMSGVHYNFSWEKTFWEHLSRHQKFKGNLPNFISEQYLRLTRNYFRDGWLMSYLFGASPMVDISYIDEIEAPFKRWMKKSAYAPYATSIRMSHLGYYSKIQNQLRISFNSLSEYLKDLEFALTTPHPFYQKIGLMKDNKRIQMNENFLQIEAEHYSRIRPKSLADSSLRPIEALRNGIDYFEVRNIDLCPSCPFGIDLDMLRFMHLFFIGCLAKQSPPLDADEAKLVCMHQDQVALCGRDPKLKLYDSKTAQKIWMNDLAHQILEDLEPIAELLDDSKKLYSKTLQAQVAKVVDSSLTPSHQQLELIQSKKMEFQDFVYAKAKEHKKAFLSKPLSKTLDQKMQKLAQTSIEKLKEEEKEQEDVLAGYEDMEFSTQMLIKAARHSGHTVRILDRMQNVIEIKNAHKNVIVKQATQSAKDTLISYLIMENKYVTQTLLDEKGLSSTQAKLYSKASDALERYALFEHLKLVVKPNHANFGSGIFFIDPHQRKEFKKACLSIEALSDQILVEPFSAGEEYRFLIIGGKVIAIAKRTPPSITGDAQSTIEQLIKAKNILNERRQSFQKPIVLDAELLSTLKKSNLNPKSILEKNQKLFLRQNSNVSTGGESIDATDWMHSDYRKIAEKAAQVVDAKICGVDILIQKPKSKASLENHVILELNHNPALYIHRYPSAGPKRYVEKDVLKFLMR